MHFSTTTVFGLLSTLAAITTASSLGGNSLPPSADMFRREVEHEIYRRELAELGLSTRDEHPDHAMVAREVENAVANYVYKRMLLPRMPHVDCSTLLPSCTYNAECQVKSAECAGCINGRCTENRPPRSPSPSSSSSSGRSRGSSGHGRGGSARGSSHGRH